MLSTRYLYQRFSNTCFNFLGHKPIFLSDRRKVTQTTRDIVWNMKFIYDTVAYYVTFNYRYKAI